MAKGEAESMTRETAGLESEKRALLNVLNQQAREAETLNIEQSLKDTAAALEIGEKQRSEVASRLGELQKELGALESVEASRRSVIRRRDSLAAEMTAVQRTIA